VVFSGKEPGGILLARIVHRRMMHPKSKLSMTKTIPQRLRNAYPTALEPPSELAASRVGRVYRLRETAQQFSDRPHSLGDLDLPRRLD